MPDFVRNRKALPNSGLLAVHTNDHPLIISVQHPRDIAIKGLIGDTNCKRFCQVLKRDRNFTDPESMQQFYCIDVGPLTHVAVLAEGSGLR
jgi:hypothetical protein